MNSVRHTVASWFLAKWHTRLAECGDVQHVARQTRKQGVPLEVALAVLGRRSIA